MLWSRLPNPLVVIIGPTAVGKTELSLQLAERLNGEIISADSRLLYRGMDIGTAKPSLEQRQRVPHHLVDVADPNETWSLAVFKQAADETIREAQRRGRLPILVGGTGQYVRAILEDWTIPSQQPNLLLRRELEAWGEQVGMQGLHDRLAVLDNAAAAQIDPRNVRRTIRALEVILMTGRRFSDQRRKLGSPYSRLLIGLNRSRAELFERIDDRIDAMITGGLLEEVRALLERGYTPDLPSFSAIGYREMAAVIKSQISLEEAVAEMKRITRVFVRRQANWFRENDPAIHWFDAESVKVEEIETLVADPGAWQAPDRAEI